MTEPLAGIPESLAGVEIDDAAVHVTVDDQVYPLEAVYGASFTFIDRCFVFIDRPAEGRIRIVLSAKKPGADAEALRALAGELANELLACAYRRRITEANRATIEAVTMQAMAGAMGPPSLDELEDFDFTEEPFEDPLGIAMSWEEKHGKKPRAKPRATLRAKSREPKARPRGREPVCVRRPTRSPVTEAPAPPNVPEFSSGLRPSCDPGEGGACHPPRAKRGHKQQQATVAPRAKPRETRRNREGAALRQAGLRRLGGRCGGGGVRRVRRDRAIGRRRRLGRAHLRGRRGTRAGGGR